MIAPIIVGNAISIATRSYALLPILYAYFLLMSLGLIIYMVRATMQYGRWLRDNYADLEHKEVWQSFMVLAIILLAFAIYVFIYEGTACLYAIQVIIAMLICYLLWRVETLSDLSIPVNNTLSLSIRNSSAQNLGLSKNIGPLLKHLHQWLAHPALHQPLP